MTLQDDTQKDLFDTRTVEKFRVAVETAPSGMILVNQAGRIALVNAQVELMFGYAAAQMQGEPIELLLPPTRRARHRSLRAEFQHRPETRAMASVSEISGVRKDGSSFPVEVGLNPMRSEDGLITLVSVIDITERQAAAAKIRRYTAELERSNAELERFAHVASHDLREPLRGMTSFAQLLKKRYGDRLEESANRYLDFIVAGAARMQEMIDGLLEYSRVGRGERPMANIDSQELIKQVLLNLAASLRECRARVCLGELPSMMGQPAELLRLFQNLLENALKFRAREEPRIWLGAVRHDGDWRFCVRDDGIGIDPQHHERIFGIFERLHEQGRYPGTGIGLPIARKIVEGHGGRLWLESTPGAGSSFYFTIPAAKEEDC